MPVALSLTIGDVTKPRPPATTTPTRTFRLSWSNGACLMDFDDREVLVPWEDIHPLLHIVGSGSSVTEWRHSQKEEIRKVFRPLQRLLEKLDSTPAYQLFLAGFCICEAIGFFDRGVVRDPQIIESFSLLVGPVFGPSRRAGRLFFLPEQYITSEAAIELIANSKLASAEMETHDSEHHSHEKTKWFVPYATPIGFNAAASDDTQAAWSRINKLISTSPGAGDQ